MQHGKEMIRNVIRGDHVFFLRHGEAAFGSMAEVILAHSYSKQDLIVWLWPKTNKMTTINIHKTVCEQNKIQTWKCFKKTTHTHKTRNYILGLWSSLKWMELMRKWPFSFLSINNLESGKGWQTITSQVFHLQDQQYNPRRIRRQMDINLQCFN